MTHLCFWWPSWPWRASRVGCWNTPPCRRRPLVWCPRRSRTRRRVSQAVCWTRRHSDDATLTVTHRNVRYRSLDGGYPQWGVLVGLVEALEGQDGRHRRPEEGPGHRGPAYTAPSSSLSLRASHHVTHAEVVTDAGLKIERKTSQPYCNIYIKFFYSGERSMMCRRSPIA